MVAKSSFPVSSSADPLPTHSLSPLAAHHLPAACRNFIYGPTTAASRRQGLSCSIRAGYLANAKVNFFGNEYTSATDPDSGKAYLCDEFLHVVTLRCGQKGAANMVAATRHDTFNLMRLIDRALYGH